MKTMNIDTMDSTTIKRLINQMQTDELDQLMTTNEQGELVRVELYSENESVSESKEHLRYVIYHNEQLRTEFLFEYNGNLMYQSSYTEK